jgi:hypothetical protein
MGELEYLVDRRRLRDIAVVRRFEELSFDEWSEQTGNQLPDLNTLGSVTVDALGQMTFLGYKLGSWS